MNHAISLTKVEVTLRHHHHHVDGLYGTVLVPQHVNVSCQQPTPSARAVPNLGSSHWLALHSLKPIGQFCGLSVEH